MRLISRHCCHLRCGERKRKRKGETEREGEGDLPKSASRRRDWMWHRGLPGPGCCLNDKYFVVKLLSRGMNVSICAGLIQSVSRASAKTRLHARPPDKRSRSSVRIARIIAPRRAGEISRRRTLILMFTSRDLYAKSAPLVLTCGTSKLSGQSFRKRVSVVVVDLLFFRP